MRPVTMHDSLIAPSALSAPLFDRMDGTAAATDRKRLLVNRSTARVTATSAAGPTMFSWAAFLDTKLKGSTVSFFY